VGGVRHPQPYDYVGVTYVVIAVRFYIAPELLYGSLIKLLFPILFHGNFHHEESNDRLIDPSKAISPENEL
jgi:hypothetical protein